MSKTCLPSESCLPDDAVIDILSRLKAKDVLRSRCVCRRWNYLTSTREFTDSFFRRSFPMFLKYTESISKGYNARNLVDGCWEPTSPSIIYKVYQPYQHGFIYFSHNGLIVTRGNGSWGVNYVIYNPIYTHAVNISLEPYRGDLCGVFYHPVEQEYCILCQIIQSDGLQYKILNLESNPKKWRDVRNPCSQNTRMSNIPPVLIDKYLYWMVEPSQKLTCTSSRVDCDIIEYDITKEEFRVIPCPARVGVTRNMFNTLYDVNLVDRDGVLSVVQLLPSNHLAKINIWTLKDDGEQLWTSCNYFVNTEYKVPTPIGFRDGELILVSNGRLHVCNLKLETFRMFEFGREHSHNDIFLSHVLSLHSLKNFQSNICAVDCGRG